MIRRLPKIKAGRRITRGWLARHLKDERGVQLVEMAIVVPIFLILFAAVAEFGRYFYEYTTLAKASRAGARYLITAAPTPAEDDKARKIVVFGNVNGTGSPLMPGLALTNVTITRQGDSAVPETIKVQITNFKHQPLFDLGALIKVPSLSTNVDVKPSVTMRYLITQPLI